MKKSRMICIEDTTFVLTDDAQILSMETANQRGGNSFSWIKQPQVLLSIDNKKIETNIKISTNNDKNLIIAVKIQNLTQCVQEVKIVFPQLHLSGTENFSYCFPTLMPYISSACNKHEMDYSTWFPLQFISIYSMARGYCLTILTNDKETFEKKYFLDKAEDNTIYCGVSYKIKLDGMKEVALEAILNISKGDWHQSLICYREIWNKSHQLVASPEWLKKMFILRQWFCYENYDSSSWWDTSKNAYCTLAKLEEDIKAFGGIDYIQLFDWAQTPQHGRVGDYDSWQDYLFESRGGDIQDEIEILHKNGVKVGLYFEGYLVDRKSDIGKVYGEEWQVRNKKQKVYSYTDNNYWTICSKIDAWNRYLKGKIVKTMGKLSVDGIYIDEYGHGKQYSCYSKKHIHNYGSQLQAEGSLLQELSKEEKLDRKAVLTEYFPIDNTLSFQNSSLTYGNGLINLTRFVFPEFKQFVIIRCDEPIGDDVDSIKKVFFNGQGIWLSGPCNNQAWFSAEVLEFIRRMYHIFKDNCYIFSSNSCIPLKYYDKNGICINEFRDANFIIWTVYNLASTHSKRKFIMDVTKGNIAHIMDIWNDEQIEFSYDEQYGVIFQLEVEAHSISCIKFWCNNMSI